MKNASFLLLVLFSFLAYSQQDMMNNQEFNDYALQCDEIGKALVNKKLNPDLSNWYSGADTATIKQYISELQSDINRSDQKVSYYWIMHNDNPMIYSLHFHDKDTRSKYGYLFLYFNDTADQLVDEIKFVSKRQLEFTKAN